MHKAQSLFNYAFVLKQKNLHDDAAETMMQALKICPGDAAALALLAEPLGLRPDLVEAHRRMADVHAAHGSLPEAIGYICSGIQIDPHDIASWRYLAKAALLSQKTELDPTRVEADLLLALGEERAEQPELAATALFLLRRAPWFPACALDDGVDFDAIAKLFASGAFDPLLRSRLFCRAIEVDLLCDPAIERLLTLVRRFLLKGIFAEETLELVDHAYLPFACALATHCFSNEYIFAVSTEEATLVQSLRDVLEKSPAQALRHPGLLAVVGAYRQLSALPLASVLQAFGPPSDATPLARLIKQQVYEPLRERELRAAVTTITPVVDGVSQAVQSQYEENPYPRWSTLALPKPARLDARLGELFPQLPPDTDLDLERPLVLVAGCGTGRHPIGTAATVTGARVTAVDLSSASLAYATRKAAEMGVTNITFLQGDILELASLGQKFDVIECGGVLHHLSDPLRGWRVLLGLLKRDGIMGIGLYSRVARRHINAARTFARVRGYGSTVDDMRRARQEILALPPDAPERQVAASVDFFSTSGCRDLLFHVQEHQFDMDRLSATFEELNLELLGFRVSSEVMSAFRSRFPDAKDAASLVSWKIFEEENPDTFSNMYQFWVRKKP